MTDDQPTFEEFRRSHMRWLRETRTRAQSQVTMAAHAQRLAATPAEEALTGAMLAMARDRLATIDGTLEDEQ